MTYLASDWKFRSKTRMIVIASWLLLSDGPVAKVCTNLHFVWQTFPYFYRNVTGVCSWGAQLIIIGQLFRWWLAVEQMTCKYLIQYPPRSSTTYGPQIARFMGPTWGQPGSCRPQMAPMLAPWTMLSTASMSCIGIVFSNNSHTYVVCDITKSLEIHR